MVSEIIFKGLKSRNSGSFFIPRELRIWRRKLFTEGNQIKTHSPSCDVCLCFCGSSADSRGLNVGGLWGRVVRSMDGQGARTLTEMRVEIDLRTVRWEEDHNLCKMGLSAIHNEQWSHSKNYHDHPQQLRLIFIHARLAVLL